MKDTLKILEQEGFCTKKQFDNFCKMVDKIKNNGEAVIGWHGTRASIAQKIEKTSFRNFRCEEGGYGVYFADEDEKEVATYFALRKCKEKNEKKYALIKAKIKHPNPDLLMGRAQWLAQAKNVEILEIKYFKI